MSVRIILSILLAGPLFLPGIASAQEAASPPKEEQPGATGPVTQEQFQGLQQRVEDLGDAIKTLTEQLAAGNQRSLVPVVPAPEEPADDRADAAPTTAVEEVREQINQLWEHVLELETVQGQIAQEVAQPDGARLLVPDIRGNMERSTAFRQEVSAAVHEVLRRQGTLRIENQTAVGHTIRVVNTDRSVYIPPGGISAPIDVPVGTVSTELVGYEAPRNWTIGPPDYEQRITIKPTSGSVRILDAAPLLSPTGFYWDPIWGGYVLGP
ncbi:MAG TPA: hypothetical protein VMY37_33480 [Thermoguttaceae bacterium]|nr:hypothetical protein [Thermoguttaceae bacterium]